MLMVELSEGGNKKMKLNLFRVCQIWAAGFIIGSAALLWAIFLTASYQTGQVLIITTNQFNEMFLEFTLLGGFLLTAVYLYYRRADLLQDIEMYRQILAGPSDRERLNKVLAGPGKPDTRNNIDILKAGITKVNKVLNETAGALSTELEPLSSMSKAGDRIGQEFLDTRPNTQYNPGNIEQFNLRQFSNNDDWLNMIPAQKK
jgi:hypothetical protein